MGATSTTGADAMVEALRARGAATIEHPGGDLLSHLQRTAAVLESWAVDEPLRRAGLAHAAYGTDGFRTALFELAERDQVRELIGPDAEAIVYTYCSCDRARTYARLGDVPVRLTDRFTAADVELGPEAAAAFASLSVANELDIARHGTVGPAAVTSISELIRALRPLAPDIADRALAEIDGVVAVEGADGA